jgi:hypothetical protein
MYALCLVFKYLRGVNSDFNYPWSRTFVIEAMRNWSLHRFPPIFLLIIFPRPLKG